MFSDPFIHRDSPIHRLDPRGRLVVGVAFAFLLAMCRDPTICLSGLLLGIFLCMLAWLPLGATARRLVALNTFTLLLAVSLPFGVAGTPLWQVGPFAYSGEGLARVGVIALKANAIVLVYTALVSTLNPFVLGHALEHLCVPRKLTLLYCFTVRYVATIKQQYDRLRTAMHVRGFRPRADLHTLRSVAHLVSMLLVRSFDRSERVLAAMKCRGFRGTFWLLDHFHFGRHDAAFVAAAAFVLVTLGWGEWLTRT